MSNKSFLARLVSSIWHGVDGVRKILHLLLLVMLFLGFFGAISSAPPLLPKHAVLFLQPVGPLVDQLNGDPYDRALAELIDALEDKGTLRSDGAVGRRSLEMVMAIYQSQLEGNNPVRFPVSLAESGVEALRREGNFVERAS